MAKSNNIFGSLKLKSMHVALLCINDINNESNPCCFNISLQLVIGRC